MQGKWIARTTSRFAAKALLFLALLVGATALYAEAPTAAGLVIKNTAAATYVLDGQYYRIESNQVRTEVRALYGLSIKRDATLAAPEQSYASPGTRVVLPFSLTNTGNAPDRYNLALQVHAGSDLPGAAPAIYADRNGNGLLDPEENVIGTTDILEAGATIHLLVALDAASNAASGQSCIFTLLGTSLQNASKFDDDNWRKVTVSTDASLAVSKSSALTRVRSGDILPYSIKISNTGNTATTPCSFPYVDLDGDPATFEIAEGLLISDPIPAGTHITGNPAADFATTNSAAHRMLYGYSNGSWSTDGAAAAWGGTASIARVGMFLPGVLAREQSAAFSWNAVVDTMCQADTIQNTALVTWANAAGNTNSFTNTVTTQVSALSGLAIGPRNNPLAGASGQYLTPDLVSGPHAISYTDDVSTAAFASSAATESSRISFWNTLQNTGNSTDFFDIEYEWASNPLATAGIRIYSADGLTPLASARGASSARIGPLAPGATYSFRVEVLISAGIPGDILPHDLELTAFSLNDSALRDSTIDRILFAGTMWTPFRKTARPDRDVVPGETIHYSILFGNADTVDATNASLFDILPALLSPPSNITTGSVQGTVGGIPVSIPVTATFTPDIPSGARGKLVWVFPSIPKGFTGTVSFDAVLDANAVDGAEINNTASIMAQGLPTAISNTTGNMAMRAGRLSIEKTVDKATAGTSSIIRYTVRVQNNSVTAPIHTPLSITDTLPKGFNYVPGSATLDGASLADPIVRPDTQTLLWTDIGDLLPSARKTLGYSVKVGPSSLPGENHNTVYAKGTLHSGTVTASGIASARIMVFNSLNLDSQTIIGRVFYDTNNNSILDYDEPGQAGIRLYLENGTYTVTDSQGRYHFEDIKAGRHVIKLDRTTLPSEASILPISCAGGLGDTDSILVNLLRGQLYKANFRLAAKDTTAWEYAAPPALPSVGVDPFLPSWEYAPEPALVAPPAATAPLLAPAPAPEIPSIDAFLVNVQPADEAQNKIEISIEKTIAESLRFPYLLIVPENPSMLDGIDPMSIFVGGKHPDAAFPFDGLLWIGLNNQTRIEYMAGKELRATHCLVGITADDTIAVLQAGQDDSGQPVAAKATASAREVRDIVAIYREIQPQAGAMNADAGADTHTSLFGHGIVSPDEGATYWLRDKITVIVRFPAFAIPVLKINGSLVPDDTVGKKVLDDSSQVCQYDYIGVPLVDGNNTLEFAYGDSEGTLLFSESRTIVLAGKISAVRLTLVPETLFADGKTEPELIITPTGAPVADGSFVTLALDKGTFIGTDADPQKKGFQVRAFDGRVRVKMSRAFEPSVRTLEIAVGNFTQTVRLEFLPYMRDWIVAGYGEGTITFSLNKANQYGEIAGNPDGGSLDGRLAFFAKGTIFDRYLLTISFDSGRLGGTDSKLFQQTDPDKLYPVYGDESTQKYDAETSNGIFAKIEQGKSYLLYGDYTTGLRSTELSAYDRSFTGAKLHLEGSWYELQGFWTNTNQSFIKDELRGNGTSGYYYISHNAIIENSDKIRIETRSAADLQIILSSRTLARYVDYWINYDNGSILFSQPVHASDALGNPVFIVVSYEAKEEGEAHSIAGIRPVLKLWNILELGATAIFEQGSIYDNWLWGVDGKIQFDKYFSLKTEVAWSDVFDREILSARKGMAKTVSFKMDFGKPFVATGRYFEADENFRNPSMSSFNGAVSEYSLALKSTPFAFLDLYGDIVGKNNPTTGDTLLSFGLQSQATFNDALRMILGARYVDLKTTAFNQEAWLGKFGLSFNVTERLSSTLFVETVLSGDHVPAFGFGSAMSLFDKFTSTSSNASPLGTGYMETRELPLSSGYPDRVYLGAEYKLFDGTQLVLGHEWLWGSDSIVGRTLLGVKSWLFKTTYAYATVGLEDSVETPRNMTSMGIRHKIAFNENLSLDLGLEGHYAVTGANEGDFVAPTLGLLYQNSSFRHSLRLESRFGRTSTTVFSEIASAMKPVESLAYQIKDTLAVTQYHSGQNDYLHTLVLGLSYRPLRMDAFNLLAKVQLTNKGSVTDDHSTKLVNSIEANYQILPSLTVSAKYSMKFLYELTKGQEDTTFLDLYSFRLLYDITDHLDFGCYFGIMPYWMDGSFDYFTGIELGYRLFANFYASVGWNFKGLKDIDLVGNDYHTMGFFVSLRYKFDEGSFGLNK